MYLFVIITVIITLREVEIEMYDHDSDIAVALKKTDTGIFRYHVEQCAAFLSLQDIDY
jgi:hypothetical protein